MTFVLFQAVYELYSNLLSNQEVKFNQDSLIQIFFDLKFVTPILCSRNPQLDLETESAFLSEIQTHVTAFGLFRFSGNFSDVKVTSWLSKQKELVEMVESRFDIIELQFYRKFMVEASQKCVDQSAVLFSALVLKKPNHMNSFSFESNLLKLVPTPPKIMPLPISTLTIPKPSKTRDIPFFCSFYF